MNTKFILLSRVGLVLLATATSCAAQGVIVWSGPTTGFNHPSEVGTSVWDPLTPGVWLTRDLTQGLVNAKTEADYTHFFSPQGTEWAYGALAEYSSLTYTDWENWNGQHPPTMVGQPAVVHLMTENIYLSLTFTSWGGTGGSFSYTRSTPSPVPEPSTFALFGLAALFLRSAIHREVKAGSA